MSVLYIIFLLVSFIASAVGAVCGIGGGVIIKPTLDAFRVLDVATISFLSGCTVLVMSCYSVIRGRLAGDSNLDMAAATPLAVGAALGGILGNRLFAYAVELFHNIDDVGAVQSGCLLVVTVGTLIYTLKKDKLKTLHIKNKILGVLIGLMLGILSAFLGIGGGPINLVVLFFFFSMQTKAAAQNSLYIILFSQLTCFLSALVTSTIPPFPVLLLALMIGGGIAGGIVGRSVNKKISAAQTDKLFIGLMGVIILVNVYNIFRFTV